MRANARDTVSILLLAILAAGCSWASSVVVIRLPVEVSQDVAVSVVYKGRPVETRLAVTEKGDGKVIREVMSDSQGRAEIFGLPPGSYIISSPVSYDEVKVVAKGGTSTLPVQAVVGREPMILAKVSGTVLDPSGAVISGAIVVVEALDEERTPVAVTTSGQAGEVRLEVPEGFYVMRVAVRGFHLAEVPVKVSKNGWDGFRITLKIGGSPAADPPFEIEAASGRADAPSQ
jgi:hypothetical protein